MHSEYDFAFLIIQVLYSVAYAVNAVYSQRIDVHMHVQTCVRGCAL